MRRSYAPGKLGELAIEVLEVEVERRATGVLAQQLRASARSMSAADSPSGHVWRVGRHDVTLSARSRHRHVCTLPLRLPSKATKGGRTCARFFSSLGCSVAFAAPARRRPRTVPRPEYLRGRPATRAAVAASRGARSRPQSDSAVFRSSPTQALPRRQLLQAKRHRHERVDRSPRMRHRGVAQCSIGPAWQTGGGVGSAYATFEATRTGSSTPRRTTTTSISSI